MNKKLYLSAISSILMQLTQSYASHQEIDITFNDGTRALYSKRGISFQGPIELSATNSWDENHINVKGIHIDRSMPLDQIVQQLTLSPYIKQAILKEVEISPDERFVKAARAYQESYREDSSIDDKIIYYRNFLKLLNEHILLGSNNAKANLSAVNSQLASNLYEKAKITENLAEKICILREAYNFADVDIQLKGPQSISNKREICFRLAEQLVRHGKSANFITDVREGLKILEEAQSLGYPNTKTLMEALGYTRTLLAFMLLEQIELKDYSNCQVIRETLIEAFNIAKHADYYPLYKENLEKIVSVLHNQGVNRITHSQKQVDVLQKLKYLREGIKFFEASQQLGSQYFTSTDLAISRASLANARFDYATTLLDYVMGLSSDSLTNQENILDIFKEIDELYEVSSVYCADAKDEKDTAKIMLAELGIRLANYSNQIEDSNERVKVARRSLKFIETAQEMGHPEQQIVDTSLAQARVNLGAFLQETFKDKASSFLIFAINSLNSDKFNISPTDRTNAVVEMLTPFAEAASLFRLALEHIREAQQRLTELQVTVDAFGLTKILKGLKQLQVTAKDILIAQSSNEKLALDVKNIENYLEKVEPLVNSILSPINDLTPIVQDIEKYNLAIQYRDGKIEGYPKDSEQALNKALELFIELSVQGNEKAMHNRAMIHYKKGEYVQAYFWFKSAGEKGLQSSINNLVKLVNDPKLYLDFRKLFESVMR